MGLKHMWVRQKYQVYPEECLLIVTRLHIKCFPHKILYEKKVQDNGKNVQYHFYFNYTDMRV